MDITSQLTLLALGIMVAGSAFFLFAYPSFRRSMLDRRPFPADWSLILTQNLPIYKQLSETERLELHRLIKRFLASKRFVGCAGQTITDEVRVTIAAQACLLLLNRETYEYGDLRYILVYPSAFHVRREEYDETGLLSERSNVLLGESWSNGKVILAWDTVITGGLDFSDGHNVVLHEFAHQLDQESGSVNGLPVLGRRSAYRTWADVFSHEFLALQRAQTAQHRSPTAIIDAYGATNAAEFFAVSTEAFFEQPQALQQQHPQLFEQLRQFYRVDPRRWHGNIMSQS